MTHKFAMAAMFATLVIGCTVDDGDRCTDNYEWDDTQKACIKLSALPDSDTQVADSESENETGLGVSCDDDNDCVNYEASYCLKDPRNPTDAGMCTLLDCDAADCTGETSCCDCGVSESVDWPAPLCVPSDRVTILTTLLSCTCGQ